MPAARAKPKPEPELPVAVPAVGLAVCPLTRRRFQPQPARYVIGAAGDAEQAAGQPSDLVVLAVDPAELGDVLAALDDALDVRRVQPPG